MSTATMIGLLAGSMTTAAWLPQVIKAVRSKSTGDFSWGWFALFGFGVACWLIYGFAISAPAVILPNAVTFLLVLGLCILKVVHSGAGTDVTTGPGAGTNPDASTSVGRH